MTDAQMEFIGELGVLFESSGAQAVNGRIYGALLVSHEIELTAEELAAVIDELHAVELPSHKTIQKQWGNDCRAAGAVAGRPHP